MADLPLNRLTPHDIALLQALADGETLRSLAKLRKRSAGTLKNEIYRIRQVLGADTTAQAIAMALRRALIE